eukprot:GHRQ01009993.1.p1 GENE.GHRQ01009993.1~~GHRQ01009993.1.p1  ORF type:complete len:243 (+),score=73.66 GHRQ01009993.1:422-1150(+)
MSDPFSGASGQPQEQPVPPSAGTPGAAAAAAEAAADAGKAKASRNVKTPLQKEVLEASYQIDPSPSMQHRKALAERIGLTEEQVNSWFNGKRRRDKKKTDGPAGLPTTTAASQPAASGQQQEPPTATPADSGVGAGYASGYESDAAGDAAGTSAAASAAAPPPPAPAAAEAAYMKPDIGPILMVTVTNHAIDSLMEGLIDAGVAALPGEMIRVGGRSKSERLKPYNLHEVSGMVRCSVWHMS